MFKVYPYKLFSESATAISQALGVKRIKPEGRYVPSSRTVVLNWGNSRVPFTHCTIINKPAAVALAANKLLTFQQLQRDGISIPEFTTNRTVAQGWVSRGLRIFARHKLNGHNGDGIEIIEGGTQVVAAPLYVKYQRKDREYRVHVFNGRVIDVTEKRKRNGERGEHGSLIRNLANGYVYCRDGVHASDNVINFSVRAVRSLGLDFGAVDIIERNGMAWVLEVNSAPGISGTTLEKYLEAIRSSYNTAIQERPRMRRRVPRAANRIQNRRVRYL